MTMTTLAHAVQCPRGRVHTDGAALTVMDIELVTDAVSLMVGDALPVTLIVAVAVGLENAEGDAVGVLDTDPVRDWLAVAEAVREGDVVAVIDRDPLRLMLGVHDFDGDTVAVTLRKHGTIANHTFVNASEGRGVALT